MFTSKDGSTRNLPGERGFFGDIVSDYKAGEDQLVFAGMEGISYTGRVFEIVNGDPFGQRLRRLMQIQAFRMRSCLSGDGLRVPVGYGHSGHLYVKGVGRAPTSIRCTSF